MISEEYIHHFFKQYNIDIINDTIIQIKDVKIPNFYHWPDAIIDIKYEFCHLLYKNYANYLLNNYIHYENSKYKISNKDIVFDCGGNMGIFAAYAATKGAQVYCFEPMSFVRTMLKETQKLYPNNIHIIPYALGEKEYKTFFNQCFNPGGSHISKLQENDGNNILYTEPVNIITLDSFIYNNNIYPTFLKIDVEGSESFLINGCKKYLSNNKPIISMAAYHQNNNVNELKKQIQKINNNYKIEIYNEETLHPYIYGS